MVKKLLEKTGRGCSVISSFDIVIWVSGGREDGNEYHPNSLFPLFSHC